MGVVTKNDIADGLEEYARRSCEEDKYVAAGILIVCTGIVIAYGIIAYRNRRRNQRRET